MSQHPDSSGSPDLRPLLPRRRMLVPIFIVVAVLLFLGTEGVLYYRWATTSEPTCVLVLDFGPALRGATVAVSGEGLIEPYTATVGEAQRFTLPFYLEPDRYTVTVTYHGDKLLQTQVELTHQARGKELDLSALVPPTTAPATAPASE